MASDWIPIRLNLGEDPAVMRIAAATGLDAYAVVGRLLRVWSWANANLENGNAAGVTLALFDALVSAPGFGSAMVAAGWLADTCDDGTPGDECDDLFAPEMSDGQLEALFVTDNTDPFDPWDEDSIDADAAHVAELVECGDLCGLTVLGIPYRAMGDE